jgi:hypothetical protein
MGKVAPRAVIWCLWTTSTQIDSSLKLVSKPVFGPKPDWEMSSETTNSGSPRANALEPSAANPTKAILLDCKARTARAK